MQEFAFAPATPETVRMRTGVEADFFREEQGALKPFQPGLFDDLPES